MSFLGVVDDVGYVSYDSVRYWEKIRFESRDDLMYPDMEFGIFNDGVRC